MEDCRASNEIVIMPHRHWSVNRLAAARGRPGPAAARGRRWSSALWVCSTSEKETMQYVYEIADKLGRAHGIRQSLHQRHEVLVLSGPQRRVRARCRSRESLIQPRVQRHRRLSVR